MSFPRIVTMATPTAIFTIAMVTGVAINQVSVVNGILQSWESALTGNVSLYTGNDHKAKLSDEGICLELVSPKLS